MSNNILQLPLRQFKGVGPKVFSKLESMGLETVEDLLFHFPLRYQDKTRLSCIGELKEGMDAVVRGTIRASGIARGRRPTLIVKVDDGTGLITLRFFHFRRAQAQQLRIGDTITLFGQPRMVGGNTEFAHPEYMVGDREPQLEEALTPVYPVTEGMGQSTMRNLTQQALTYLTQNPPEDLLTGLPGDSPSITDSIKLLHRPSPDANTAAIVAGEHPAQLRLALEELVAHQLSLLSRRARTHEKTAAPVNSQGKLADAITSQLPFTLTGAQQRVCEEIVADLRKSTPMLRLLQGDVGSGKTLVAALTAAHMVESKHQVALMAPTELLSEQHFAGFQKWFEPLGINVLWLTGQIKGKARKAALERIEAGEVDIIVGTHALFQDAVAFKSLGLVLVDEQHRFGVNQRLSLTQRGLNEITPHQLTMTATPIPRTLSMVAYADLDCSTIDELPPGRKPITTALIDNDRRQSVIERVGNACQQGRQAYWVCALIEESEALDATAAEVTAEQLEAALPGLRIGLLHGRISSQEKGDIMAAFANHELDILVATTVIEVGVDVPNASLMIIENAERFGLAQLHQLRGRVGRGAVESHCILMYQSPLSQTARDRLTVMRESQDGFVLAEKDLEIRGPGEVLGTRQTGVSSFRVARLPEHNELLEKAQDIASNMVSTDAQRAEKIEQRWTRTLEAFAHV
ncbi:ATP-dependent DNA helicase RecG [Candidatus Paraluminiphilus aquimaris]|uniref:ATP-dependent DNA helicase RecG n=1 Tax=Candidatus Paraluminiphilus aquimaris TaxID=2518994 RepID=A0ABY6Q604_9GAMM|nr:ATP-dependent DNA helicase RecG [Candidatus Paraluminiphilus aquimaris]UZP73681.1 ATP-dependent DNA helicase RecG [Candidatus Paraluminiphilus aquimaris]